MNATMTRPKMYSSSEVLQLVPGLTYRVLDYLLRTGAVTLAADASPGSGGRRRFTETEVEALKRVMERQRKAKAELVAIHDGRAWAEEVA